MNTLILALLLACGSAEAPHGHDHEGDHAHDAKGEHHEAPEDEAHHDDGHHDDGHHDEAAAKDTIEAPLGAYTARIEPSADTLKLVVIDAEGKAVVAERDARVLLTGTGEAPQKVILVPSGEAWTGPAKVEGAPGYLAVVTVSVGGHQESARLTWGEVPAAKPAPAAHDHDDAAHDHGDGAHSH